MNNRLLIALQFWEGDKANAMQLARYLADLEPSKSQLADFLFAARFDCKRDTGTEQYVARKFNVFARNSKRRGVGWPTGCNELWVSVIEWLVSMTRARKIPRYKAVFTCEADGAPISRDWIARLLSEWDRVNREHPRGRVLIAGPMVSAPRTHINGNALINGDPEFLAPFLRRISHSQLRAGWDFQLAGEFEKIGWANIPGMQSLYASPTFSREQYQGMIDNNWIWIHGGKDLSLINYGRERFGV